MTNQKMHTDEIEIDAGLVTHLIGSQFPQWRQLAIRAVPSAGTDHALYRLGEKMVVRLPRLPKVTAQIHKEQKWLPILAPLLPVTIPRPIAQGQPDDIYPLDWSVYEWVVGRNATFDQIDNPSHFALSLADFLKSLQQIDTTQAPSAGTHNFGRGVDLIERDNATRQAIIACESLIDTAVAMSVWEQAVSAPKWEQSPVWIHGDLQSGNLLVQDGTLSAVIDFGSLAIGDPACDLQPAWNLFDVPTRAVFREAMQVDEATWLRGKGWSLSVGVIALPYYLHTNPTLADISRYAIEQVLTDT